MNSRSSRTAPTARLIGVVMLVASCVWLTGLSGTGPALAKSGGSASTLGDVIAGTWITDPLPPPEWAPQGQQIIMNFHADGTLDTSWSFELGPFGLFGNSLIQGSWTQTGPQEVTSRELAFVYTQNGVPKYTARFSNVYTFSEDFETFSLDFYEEWFLPEQDVTDPDEEPVYTFTFPTFTGKRL